MLITTVHYSALLNLGNYNNEKIGFTAEVGEGESAEEVLESLKQKVMLNAGVNADQVENMLYRGKRELAELQHKLEKAREEWNATVEFLRTQGIKPNVSPMPMFTNLLPQVKTEQTNSTEGEILESEDF